MASKPRFSGSGTPGSLEDSRVVENASRYVLMQDQSRNYQGWRANHSDGETMAGEASNPSHVFQLNNNFDQIQGANMLYFDLSVRWHLKEELVHVGGDQRFSVMPPAEDTGRGR